MGIVLIPLGVLLAGLYLWLVVKGTRWAYRRFAIPGALVALIVALLLPTWDTFANHWYHKNVLCMRSEVGVHVSQRVRLPSQYYDDIGRFKEPDGWFSGRTLINDRYQRQSGNLEEGVFPLTKYEKRFSGVLDKKENTLVSFEVDYLTKGGGWWLGMLRPLFSQADYLSYVRGTIDGVSCSATAVQGGSIASSVNAVFEQR